MTTSKPADFAREYEATRARITALVADLTAAGLIERKPALFAGLLYDVVAHEHDLRGALGSPGARDSEALRLSMITECEQLTADLTRLDLPAVRLRAGSDEWIAGSGEPELAIDTELFELFRLLGSRRSAAQMGAAPWEGDLDQFLPALAHMPLPTADLVE